VVPKRRGRPPRAKPATEAEDTVASEVVPKRRGRPPKAKPASQAEKAVDSDVVSKRRGRPRKAMPTTEPEDGVDSEMIQQSEVQEPQREKKRGRPLKNRRSAEVSQISTEQGEETGAEEDSEAEPPTKKNKRGRPPAKKKSASVPSVVQDQLKEAEEPEPADNTAHTEEDRPKSTGRGARRTSGAEPTSVPAPSRRSATLDGDDGSASASAAASTPSSGRRKRGGRPRGGASAAAAQAASPAPSAAAAAAAEDDVEADEDGGDGNGLLSPRENSKKFNLFMSREGKNAYFKVDLLLGPQGNRRRMLPFRQVQLEEGGLSVDSYVAPEGEPFAIRVKLARPRSNGSIYGGRVFIDTPCDCDHHEGADEHDHVCDSRAKNSAVSKQLNALADHFFWIGPGETEYVIEGFYASRQTSRQFVFAPPPRNLKLDVGVEDDPPAKTARLMKVWRSIGGIRIAFSLIDHWKKREKPSSHAKPKQAAIDRDAHVDRKGKCLSAAPGIRIEDQLKPTEREAVLMEEILFEKRIQYNTFGGYKAAHDMQRHVHSVGLYKALPLDVLRQTDVRRQCINVYMNKVPKDQMEDDFNNSLEESFNKTRSLNPTEAGESSQEGDRAAAAAAAAANEPDFSVANPSKWVRVPDLCRAISNDLSPAGSYIICTGKDKEGDDDEGGEPRNYGEEVVQNMESTDEEKMADFEHKQKRLAMYFNSQPQDFDCRHYTDEASGRKYFEVQRAVVDLTLSDDSDVD